MALLVPSTGSTQPGSDRVTPTDSTSAVNRLATVIIIPGDLPTVTIQGNVQYPAVVWHDEMTLARALLLAQYRGYGNPFGISITRNGRRYPINMNQFLRGQINPLLNPGDLVEVR